jgi:hypothetical protein
MDYNLGRFRLNPKEKFDPKERLNFIDIITDDD